MPGFYAFRTVNSTLFRGNQVAIKRGIYMIQGDLTPARYSKKLRTIKIGFLISKLYFFIQSRFNIKYQTIWLDKKKAYL